MNTEMNNNNNNNKNNVEGMSVTSLLLKTLENATKDYARECIMKCALSYGFDGLEAQRRLNLENLTIQVKEMKRRSGAKKAKTEKTVAEKKEKVAEKKVVSKVEEIMLPFLVGAIKESGCMGLAYNSGLFTQCKKTRKLESEYCKTCFREAEESETGSPQIGTVSGRCAVGLMEFRDGKGRKPVPYSKIMKEKGISRESAELEAGKLNLTIDEVHFVVVDEKKEAGRPKREKRGKVVESAVSVEDLFASLIEEDEECSQHDTETVLCSESDSESESERQRELAHEKVERGMMKEEETGMKKVVKAEEKELKAQKLIEEKALKAQKLIEEKALKAQKLIEEKELKAQKLIEEKAAKEQKLIEEKAAKEQKLIEEKAAKEQKLIEEKELKAQKLIEEKAAKEQKLIEEKEAKELKAQKLIEEKAAKEAKIVADLAAKEQKIVQEKAAKEEKAQKLIEEKAAKEEKAQKMIEEKALKAAKIVQEKIEKEEKAQKMMEEKALKTAKIVQDKSEKEKKVEKVAEKATEAPKKVTVKRITIDGKQYLKTADNVLYNPETREEMGIYDAETNTIKELPDDDEDEIEEEGYNSD
jgi:hypothetical protein